jgi:hypothetical protein
MSIAGAALACGPSTSATTSTAVAGWAGTQQLVPPLVAAGLWLLRAAAAIAGKWRLSDNTVLLASQCLRRHWLWEQ